MKTAEEIKTLVKEKYSEIATQDPALNAASCCGVDGCATLDYSIFSENYEDLDGYLASADLQLGCGMPVSFAQISQGDTVVDLGSGAGNDVFVARALTGDKGMVYGIDMTPVMIEKAKQNAQNIGLKNVRFRLGEIENIPMTNDKADVVISNCVLNLVPDKAKAFAETYRILKPGGHFCISDVVLKGDLPAPLKLAAELYAGCVSGALQYRDYLGIVHETGFQRVSVMAEKEIDVPDEILLKYMSQEELTAFRQSSTGIFSITVYAEKLPVDSCDPSSGCC